MPDSLLIKTKRMKDESFKRIYINNAEARISPSDEVIIDLIESYIEPRVIEEQKMENGNLVVSAVSRPEDIVEVTEVLKCTSVLSRQRAIELAYQILDLFRSGGENDNVDNDRL